MNDRGMVDFGLLCRCLPVSTAEPCGGCNARCARFARSANSLTASIQLCLQCKINTFERVVCCGKSGAYSGACLVFMRSWVRSPPSPPYKTGTRGFTSCPCFVLSYPEIPNSCLPFSVVIRSTSAALMPLISAIVSAMRCTYSEELRRPRNGSGAM